MHRSQTRADELDAIAGVVAAVELRQIVSVTSTRPGWATRSPEASV